jgi:hypothetical protein
LRIEELEQRWLLTVTVDLAQGQLGILGTTGADDVSIVQFAPTANVPAALQGKLAVIAHDTITTTNAANTGVGASVALPNGYNAVPIDTALFSADVKVKLGDGDDKLSVGSFSGVTAADVTRLSLPDDLRVDVGSSSDTVTITNTDILNHKDDNHRGRRGTANLDVKLGSGNNTLTATNDNVNGNVRVKGEHGADQVTLTGSTFHDKVNLDLGGGNDQVSVPSGTFSDPVKVSLGSGDDSVSLGNPTFQRQVTVDGGSGNDSIAVPNAPNVIPTFDDGFSQINIESKFRRQ